MRAHLKDGQIIDLGSDYIVLVGDSEDGDHILIDRVRGGLKDCLVTRAVGVMLAGSIGSRFDLREASNTVVELGGGQCVMVNVPPAVTAE